MTIQQATYKMIEGHRVTRKGRYSRELMLSANNIDIVEWDPKAIQFKPFTATTYDLIADNWETI